MSKSKLLLKVCGLREHDNIEAIAHTGIDYMGFIFYKKSKRYVDNILNPAWLSGKQFKPAFVGVFVDEQVPVILERANDYQLQVVQLHGDESPEVCDALQKEGLKVWKVFNVGNDFDFILLNTYESVVDAFLFDTKGEAKGGNGKPFDWQILKAYTLKTPFYLSGGLSCDNIEDVLQLQLPALKGVDVNSKLEDAPGRKNVDKVREIKGKL